MPTLRERHLVGLDHLEAATTLLQRNRLGHATAGLYEAADLQWWWRTPRSTDHLAQIYWFDDLDRPTAAVIATDWGDRVALDPIVLPGTAPDWTVAVIERGLARAGEAGWKSIGFELDPADEVLRAVLVEHGFEIEEGAMVEAWLTADDRPAIDPPPEGYRLSTRVDANEGSHHMTTAGRNHPDVEMRLRQTSLYRPDLDLVVHDGHGDVAGYGLFWYDPVTATGLVEPIRTEDAHQRRGLARHILTSGLDLLARAGAERIKVCYEPDNAAARHLYLGVGFEQFRQTAVCTRTTSDEAA